MKRPRSLTKMPFFSILALLSAACLLPSPAFAQQAVGAEWVSGNTSLLVAFDTGDLYVFDIGGGAYSYRYSIPGLQGMSRAFIGISMPTLTAFMWAGPSAYLDSGGSSQAIYLGDVPTFGRTVALMHPMTTLPSGGGYTSSRVPVAVVYTDGSFATGEIGEIANPNSWHHFEGPFAPTLVAPTTWGQLKQSFTK